MQDTEEEMNPLQNGLKKEEERVFNWIKGFVIQHHTQSDWSEFWGH